MKRPKPAVRECFLISYIDPVNSMKNNMTPTPSVGTVPLGFGKRGSRNRKRPDINRDW